MTNIIDAYLSSYGILKQVKITVYYVRVNKGNLSICKVFIGHFIYNSNNLFS